MTLLARCTRFAALLALAGCNVEEANIGPGAASGGSASSGNGSGGSASGGQGATSCQHSLSRRVRRLAAREYLNVLTDLLGPTAAEAARPLLPFEPRLAGFDNQDSGLLVSAAFQEALFNIAERVAKAADVAALAPCTASDNGACLSSFAQAFARKAYGRSPSTEELGRLLAAAATGESYASSVRLIIETVLQSPNTVYATELGAIDAGKSGAEVTLTQHEVASQMALVLTGARPDEALLQAADAGQLASVDQLRAHMTRLLATAPGTLQLRHFINGWLDMGPVATAPKDVADFPEYTPALAAAMQQELDTFIDQKVAGGSGSLLSLLSDQSTDVPPALASIYGVDLTPNGLDPAHRRGILSLPGLLTYHSADQHSGPIERGLFIKRQLFCQELPPPPPSVLDRLAAMPIDNHDKATTTRMRYERHVNEPLCAGCHDQFDGIGFGLEQMDALGRFRTTENGLPVDSSGKLAGTDVDGPFSGAVQLADKLAQSQQFKTCFTEHFFRFAVSRPPRETEQCLVETWAQAFSTSGTRFQDLVASWLSNPRFAQRLDDR